MFNNCSATAIIISAVGQVASAIQNGPTVRETIKDCYNSKNVLVDQTDTLKPTTNYPAS